MNLYALLGICFIPTTLFFALALILNKNPKNVQEVRAIFHDFYEERQKIYKDLCDVEVKLEHSASKSENMKKILTALGIVGTLCDGSASKILHYEL